MPYFPPASGASGLYTAYLCYQDQEASGTNGGTFTSGAWQTRVLNATVADTGSIGSLSSNQITLPAGTYRLLATAPTYSTNANQLRLQNITDSTTLLWGQSVDAGTSAGCSAVLQGRFTLAGSKTLALQHRCQSTLATFGFGVAGGFGGTETYAAVELWKE